MDPAPHELVEGWREPPSEVSMIDSTISHYKILEKLGEGGMGVVYKAQDLNLDRIVALKFLPERASSGEESKFRFLQEAKAAASLNHSNICTIYGVEEHQSQMFIAMEFVDGGILRNRIPFTKTDEAIIIAIQIGEALAEAHSKGIVHRDIKADNVMLTAKAQVKVMDFGLAKLKGSLKLTRSSSTVGTLAYMAPEQIQGGEVDLRSDLFAFGVLLFEMLTGKLPFRGEHEAAMMYSILNEEPENIRKYISDISTECERILEKSLEKNPEERYQSAVEMVADLKRWKRETGRVTRPPMAQQSTAMRDGDFQKSVENIGSMTSRISATKSWKRTLLSAGGAVILVAAIIAGYFTLQRQDERLDSLAVMPFVNATTDPGLEYLSDGITESVISHLSKLSNLRVMSRNSVFRYKGKEIDPQEVGKTLGVRAILTGRMSQRPDGFSVSLELINTKDNRQIWGDQYLRNLADISTLETQIPTEITEHLRIEQSSEERENLNTASTRSSEAYALYMKGRFNWNKRLPEALHRAVDFFSQAIEKDPSYALAYTGLAETYVVMPVYVYPPPKDVYQQAKYYAMKALEVNPLQAEAYSALGYAKWSQLDFAGAEADLKRAITLNPRYATAHHWYAFVLSTSGRHSEAIAEALKANDLDPLSLIIQASYAVVLQSAGRYDEAIEVEKKVLQTEPAFPIAHLGLGTTYIQSGRPSEALSEFQKAREVLGDIVLPNIAASYVMLGRTAEARTILRELEASWKKGARVESPIAMIYLALGEKDHAIEWLDKVYESRYINVAQLWNLRDFPKLSHIDTDPAIQAALNKIGVK